MFALGVGHLGPLAPADLIFINPMIVDRSIELSSDDEGCLSLPGLSVSVARNDWIELEYQTVEAESRVTRFEGFIARVIQHEIDHLWGKLILATCRTRDDARR